MLKVKITYEIKSTGCVRKVDGLEEAPENEEKTHLTFLNLLQNIKPPCFFFLLEHLPDNYHQRLKTLIEETYSINGNKKVTLISHSYGCTVTLYFLSLQTQEWKNKYLKQWIPLSGRSYRCFE